MLIYGAYGYTGELVTREAVRRGLRPVLAGRRRGPLERLAAELGLEHRTFALQDPATVAEAVAEAGVVVHCAGPFEATAPRVARACIEKGVHYLDVTGEIAVFAALHRMDGTARERGVTLLPGAGFDVVPTDCLAAHLSRRLPGARRLTLAFRGLGRPSRGTAATMARNLHRGGAIRRGGRLVAVPPAWRVREVDLGRGPERCVSIPWGDVYTAHVSTAIPDVEVYMAAPPALIALLRATRWLRPLLALRPVRAAVGRAARWRPAGPSPGERRRATSVVWGEVEDGAGRRAAARLWCPEGYTFTALAAVELAVRVEAGEAGPGFRTPSQAFGPDLVLGIGETVREDLPTQDRKVEETWSG